MKNFIFALIAGLFSVSAFAAAHNAAPAPKRNAEANAEKAHSKHDKKTTAAKGDAKSEKMAAESKSHSHSDKPHAHYAKKDQGSR